MQGIEHVLANAFIEGEGTGFAFGECELEIASPGVIELTEGKLVACDPLVFPNRKAFSLDLPNGRFPVFLSVAKFDDNQRIAFARVQFHPQPVAEWKMALVPGQDVADLKEDEFYGYGVDSGIGCFMAPEAQKHLEARMDENEEYYEDICDLMEKTYRHTWSWANFSPGGDGTANVVTFSTGIGDGFYGSYFGFDDKGQVLCAVTDFGLFDPPGCDD